MKKGYDKTHIVVSSWAKYVVGHCSVLKRKEGYLLYYHGTTDEWRGNASYQMGVLSSPDLFSWKPPFEDNRIFKLERMPSWANRRSYGPFIAEFDSGILELYFSVVGDDGRIRIARGVSKDGLSWQLNPKRPIFQQENDVYSPCVFQRNGMYYMVFSEVKEGQYNIKLAKSGNRVDWEIEKGFRLDANDLYVLKTNGFIIDNKNKSYLYYTAGKKGERAYSIRLAISEDGFYYKDYKQSALSPGKRYNEEVAMGPFVIREGKKWFMFYESEMIGVRPLGETSLAVSEDGINWVRYSDNPILRSNFREEIIDRYLKGESQGG